MTLNKEAEVLRDVPLFSKIDHTKLKLLAFTSENLIHQDGQFLFREGETGDAAYIVLKGKVAVFIETEKGPVEVAQLKRGQNFRLNSRAVRPTLYSYPSSPIIGWT